MNFLNSDLISGTDYGSPARWEVCVRNHSREAELSFAIQINSVGP